MTLREFAAAQIEDRNHALPSLVVECVRKFRLACDLVGIDGPLLKKLNIALYDDSFALEPLQPAWEVICTRYRQEKFDLNPNFFTDHREDSLNRWRQFRYWELFPALVSDNECVRNVLRATGLLPTRSVDNASPIAAGSALAHYLEEMSLPFGSPPPA